MGGAQHVGVILGGCGQHDGNNFVDGTLMVVVITRHVCSEVGGVLSVGGAYFSG